MSFQDYSFNHCSFSIHLQFQPWAGEIPPLVRQQESRIILRNLINASFPTSHHCLLQLDLKPCKSEAVFPQALCSTWLSSLSSSNCRVLSWGVTKLNPPWQQVPLMVVHNPCQVWVSHGDPLVYLLLFAVFTASGSSSIHHVLLPVTGLHLSPCLHAWISLFFRKEVTYFKNPKKIILSISIPGNNYCTRGAPRSPWNTMVETPSMGKLKQSASLTCQGWLVFLLVCSLQRPRMQRHFAEDLSQLEIKFINFTIKKRRAE